MAKEYLKVGCALAEGVRGDRFVYLCEAGGGFDCFLQGSFVNVMPPEDTGDRIRRTGRGRENILPAPFAAGIRIFAFQSIGQVDSSKAFGEIALVQGLDLVEGQAQGFEQSAGKHGDAVVFAPSAALRLRSGGRSGQALPSRTMIWRF